MCDVLISFYVYYIFKIFHKRSFFNALLFSNNFECTLKLKTEEAWEETIIKHLPSSKLHMPPTKYGMVD